MICTECLIRSRGHVEQTMVVGQNSPSVWRVAVCYACGHTKIVPPTHEWEDEPKGEQER